MENFCEKCGTELIDGVCPECAQRKASLINKNEEKFADFFMSPNEKMVAVLGNSYLENFFYNGYIEKGFAVVSDKRVYFQGNNYFINRDIKGKKKLFKNHQSRIVDLRDVTGTVTDTIYKLSWKIWGIIFTILFFIIMFLGGRIESLFFILPVLFCAYKYESTKISIITIQYASGEIGFNKKWFTQQEIELFEKQTRLAKDKIVEASDNTFTNGLQEVVSSLSQSVISQTSKADELSKLANLLIKGVITQEEFDKMKKELI